MYVVDEITHETIHTYEGLEVIVGISEGIVILGYVSCHSDMNLSTIGIYNEAGYIERKPFLKDALVGATIEYSNFRGMYFISNKVPKCFVLKEKYIAGVGGFPYAFAKKYEAVDNFQIFDGKQVYPKCSENDYPLHRYMHYTFGLEFETSQGFIPEDLCFKNGLIPLRDGSITGLEYSTIVLEGQKGLALLDEQVKCLKKYTYFNKECSLHIHVGGFPLTSEYIWKVYLICYAIELPLEGILPKYTFTTNKYKSNGKDYCKRLAYYKNFNNMYEKLVGRKYLGSLTQPHPDDLKRQAKWHISTRYYWVNFINSLCYNVNKTIEFRFLRPTYNFNKIVLWLYIFNAILNYAEISSIEHLKKKNFSLADILSSVYPVDVAEEVSINMSKLEIAVSNQASNGDYIGRDTEIENEILNDNFNL